MRIYQNIFKRPFDIALSLIGLLFISPLFIVLAIVGSIKMQGNPFFVQERPGKDEKLFKLVKFRTMNEKTDEKGVLLPDLQRLTKYGRFLRDSSLDELPELFNILKGNMSLVGPRPLLTKYLPLYSDEQRRRHEVKPGLTGYAQVMGRNSSSWGESLKYDVQYVDNITFVNDICILFKTTISVFQKKDIDTSETTKVTRLEFNGNDKEH